MRVLAIAIFMVLLVGLGCDGDVTNNLAAPQALNRWGCADIFFTLESINPKVRITEVSIFCEGDSSHARITFKTKTPAASCYAWHWAPGDYDHMIRTEGAVIGPKTCQVLIRGWLEPLPAFDGSVYYWIGYNEREGADG